ncbi:MAG: hypothetical protein AB4372_28925 [Xenococcus sp. (in: cyanobacteria)]
MGITKLENNQTEAQNLGVNPNIQLHIYCKEDIPGTYLDITLIFLLSTFTIFLTPVGLLA